MAKAFKFNRKDTMKYGGMALGVTAGFIAGQRIKLAELFKQGPDTFVAKYEGWLKFGGALALIPLVKNPMLRSVLIGIAAGGAVSGVSNIMAAQGLGNRTFKMRSSRMGAEQPWATQTQVAAGASIGAGGQSHQHNINQMQPFPQRAYGSSQPNGIPMGVGVA